MPSQSIDGPTGIIEVMLADYSKRELSRAAAGCCGAGAGIPTNEFVKANLGDS
jgi:hypothetical protein